MCIAELVNEIKTLKGRRKVDMKVKKKYKRSRNQHGHRREVSNEFDKIKLKLRENIIMFSLFLNHKN